MNDKNKDGTLSELLRRWDARGEDGANSSAEFFAETAQQAISLGHNSLAYDMLKEGMVLHG